MQHPLSYDTLGQLDAVADLDDRGGDGLARKVEIVVSLKQMDNGLIETHVEASARLPRRRTASTIGKIKRDGNQQSRLLFQDMAPEDPDQRTLDELEPRPES